MAESALIADLFLDAARTRRDKVALVCGGAELTYGALAGTVQAYTDALEAEDVGPGARIGVMLPNGVPFVVLMLAAARLGAALVPVSPSLPEAGARASFCACGCTHAAIWHGRLRQFDAMVSAGPVPADRILSVGGEVEGTRTLLSDWLASATFELDDRADDAVRADPDRPYILTTTSGSTGAPKPIVLSQRTKVLRARAAMDAYGVTPDDITLAATPLYHSLAMRLMLLPLISGGTAVLMPHFTPDQWLKTVAEHRVSFTMAVSSQLESIINAPGFADSDLSSLRALVSSSAPLSFDLKSHLFEHLTCGFFECYGTSEVAVATNLGPEDPPEAHDTVGRPAPGVDLRVLGDDLSPCPPDVPGEIAVRTPLMFSGYEGMPDETRAAMADGYVRTGDLGVLDGRGYLRYLGRLKEIIITGGINVIPQDVEAVLREHPDVAECAVVGAEDAHFGEVVVAFIVPRPGTAVQDRDLRRFCLNRLADFQQPRAYRIVDDLPRNEMGKVLKRELAVKPAGR
jgi:long-chain acyl-CoA synthetase